VIIAMLGPSIPGKKPFPILQKSTKTLKAGQHGCKAKKISCTHQVSIPGLSSPRRVAISKTLFRPQRCPIVLVGLP